MSAYDDYNPNGYTRAEIADDDLAHEGDDHRDAQKYEVCS